MKTDYSQVIGFWVGVDDRLPPSPGEYIVTTTHLREHNMKWDGNKWDLRRRDDWVVYWMDCVTDPKTGKNYKTEPI